MWQNLLKRLSLGLDDFIESLALMWAKLKSEEIGFPSIEGSSTNLDPKFYLKERNYHEQAIMDINDEILELEEERSKHEYFMNIADVMYSKLIVKGNL